MTRKLNLLQAHTTSLKYVAALQAVSVNRDDIDTTLFCSVGRIVRQRAALVLSGIYGRLVRSGCTLDVGRCRSRETFFT